MVCKIIYDCAYAQDFRIGSCVKKGHPLHVVLYSNTVVAHNSALNLNWTMNKHVDEKRHFSLFAKWFKKIALQPLTPSSCR